MSQASFILIYILAGLFLIVVLWIPYLRDRPKEVPVYVQRAPAQPKESTATDVEILNVVETLNQHISRRTDLSLDRKLQIKEYTENLCWNKRFKTTEEYYDYVNSL